MGGNYWKGGGAVLVGSAMMLALSACDGGSATAPARSHAAVDAAPGSARGTDQAARRADTGSYDQPDHRKDPVPMRGGKPLWAANRRHSAEENAEYHFERDGADFDAKTMDDYVAKAHAFVDKPPARIETITRSNGDKLLYDPQRNIFAVVSKEGAPRTMFKPRDGAAYWDQQTQREADKGKSDQGGRRYGRRSGRGDDSGGDG